MDQNNPIFTPHSDDKTDNQSDDQNKDIPDETPKKAEIEPKPAEPNEITTNEISDKKKPEAPFSHVKPFKATNELTDEKAKEIEQSLDEPTAVEINKPTTESTVPKTPVSVIEKFPHEEAVKSPHPIHTFTDQNQDLAATMFPPKKTPSTVKAVVTVAVVAIAFMTFGFAGGYFGFKYSPKLASIFKTTADSSTEATTDNTKPLSTKATPSDISVWPIYNNTTYLYSVKYPDNWYSQNTNDATSKTVTFTNFAPPSKTNTEEKVEILVQSANGQDLKTWVESQSTVSQNTASLTKLTVSDQEAYQQETTGEDKNLKTYVKQSDYVITIIYSADLSVYTEGKTIYDSIIGTLKLS